MEMRILRNFAPGNQIKRYNKYSFKERKIIMLNEINWPEKYLPGTTDNFASNEVIVKGLRAADVWPYLTHATVWEKYYSNSSDARYKEDGKHINSFTNKEENIIGDTDILPFMLETELRSHGAIYEQSDPWQVYPCTVDASGTKHRRMSISVEPSTCG